MSTSAKQSPDEKQPPSEMFTDCISFMGTNVATCELCGRTIFGSDAVYDDSEGDTIETLRAKAEAEPDRFIEFQCDSSDGFTHIVLSS
jgi:hypothetical protein